MATWIFHVGSLILHGRSRFWKIQVKIQAKLQDRGALTDRALDAGAMQAINHNCNQDPNQPQLPIVPARYLLGVGTYCTTTKTFMYDHMHVVNLQRRSHHVQAFIGRGAETSELKGNLLRIGHQQINTICWMDSAHGWLPFCPQST